MPPYAARPAANVAFAAGSVSDPTHLTFPPGTLKLYGRSSETRFADGSCDDPSLDFDSVNDVDVQVRHEPALNQFALDGTFATSAGGETYALTLHLAGGFTNQPPQAALALRPIDDPYPQGGCPAFQRWTGQQWEWVAEANRPEGLVAELHSFSSDPDGGSWSQGDVLAERWFDTPGSGDRAFLGQGRQLDALTFGWGVPHRVELLAIDHAGASSAESCSFEVIDTRAPVVTPPSSIVLGCSTVGGATPATSPALQAFLDGATASDAADPAPARLTPTLGGAPVSGGTLFPADGAARAVTFPFRDFSGNVGQADASVTVKDTLAPAASASATPAALAVSYKWWWIATTLSASDNCGGAVAWRLIKITSNEPSYDASDVLNASYGTDDRGFYLFTRATASGATRVWTITYEARDAAGNTAYVKAKVTVG